MDTIYSKENVGNIYPLSPMQEGMYIYLKLFPGSTAYTQQVSFDTAGVFSADKFKKCLDHITKRHDILRTVFIESKKDGKLLQIVLKQFNNEFCYLDCTTDVQNEFEDIAGKEFNRHFDLSKGPLFRSYVLKRRANVSTIVFTFHHIILDGWSLFKILDELLYLYQTENFNGLQKITPFSEFIKWIYLGHENCHIGYWKKYLKDYKTPATIPLMENTNALVFCSSTFDITLGAAENKTLRSYSARCKITVYNIVVTCWALLLSRFNHTDDVVFGTVTSGRGAPMAGIVNVVGVIANTIPIRIRFSGSGQFVETVSDVQNESLQNEIHHYMSLAAVQSVSHLKQSLFDHIFIYENIEWEDVTSIIGSRDNIEISNLKNLARTQYNLEISVFPEREMTIRFVYNSVVISPEFIIALAGQLREIIMAVITDPEIQIKDITSGSVSCVSDGMFDFEDF